MGRRGYRGKVGSVTERWHIQKVLRFPFTVLECKHDEHNPTSTIPNHVALRAAPPHPDPGQRHDKGYGGRALSDQCELKITPL
jgi:hypothetical protein